MAGRIQEPRSLLGADAKNGDLVLAYRNNSDGPEGSYELMKTQGKTALVKSKSGGMKELLLARFRLFCSVELGGVAPQDPRDSSTEKLSDKEAEDFLEERRTYTVFCARVISPS